MNYNTILMKLIKHHYAIALLAFCIAACDDPKIEKPEDNKVDFGDIGPRIELEYVDGEYIPKAEPIKQDVFESMFKGTLKLEQIKYVSKTGKLSNAEMLPGEQYPLFGVKDGGKLRQYLYNNATNERTFKDGTYLYNPETGVLDFIDVVQQHPKFRVITIKDSEMTGTFRNQENDNDMAVLTLYVYKRLSPLDEAGIDQLYGAE